MNSDNAVLVFELQPHLVGQLVELRPLRQDDWDQLFLVASDPRIWEQHPASDRYQEPVFRKFFADAISSGGALVVIERSTGAVIGSSRFQILHTPSPEIEIGWTFLARRFWGGRYNGEVKQLMLAHAFRFVDHVIFLVGESNFRSQKALERIGASHMGVVDSPPAPGGIAGKNVKYEIRRSAPSV